jgi:aerobic-type carbon monoxide dehydrogenase small subunit (CoxS/CutS family)
MVTLSLNGSVLTVPAGTSVAAALLNRERLAPPADSHSTGRRAWHIRGSVGGQPRGPLCGMGICFECRAIVDGQPDVRTCQLPVREGMEIRTDG